MGCMRCPSPSSPSRNVAPPPPFHTRPLVFPFPPGSCAGVSPGPCRSGFHQAALSGPSAAAGAIAWHGGTPHYRRSREIPQVHSHSVLSAPFFFLEDISAAHLALNSPARFFLLQSQGIQVLHGPAQQQSLRPFSPAVGGCPPEDTGGPLHGSSIFLLCRTSHFPQVEQSA